ncbi:MAG TPA: glycosyltransferase [Gaiellaceae bacterium]|nr:glycosyltransferase [Gaiellaceae bacterium]
MSVSRVLVLSEIPTPYRLPLYERLAARPELELEIVFCSHAEPDRPWELDEALARVPHRVLRGVSPSVRTRKGTFVYQVNPGAIELAARGHHDAVVVGGYGVFAEQAAIAISRVRRVPYLLHSESTLAAPRPGAVRLAKQALVRPAVRGAAAGLAAGSEAARYLEYYGLPAERIRIVPNTIDVGAYGRAASEIRARAEEVRAAWDLPERFVLFAGRLIEDKGILDLIAARTLQNGESLPLVVAGEGRLEVEVQAAPGVRHIGFVQPERLLELFALAEWTVVPSRREPWGVVVNEALACGCPVIVTDQVGAGADLVEDGVNGVVVPAGSPEALARALSAAKPAGDPAGGRIAGWTHEYATEQFLEAVEIAVSRR